VAEGFGELRLGGVTRRFGAAVALDRLDLTIRRGEFIALLGPSGCGKSTALNCIAGLLPLSGGGIWLDDKRIDALRPEQRGFGMVFQNYALFPHMSVRKNIGFGLAMRRVPKEKIQGKVDAALDLVQLRAHAEKLPGQLSGGQQQRVAIARAIVIEPPLVLMDEPLSNLDAKLRLEMRTEIKRIHRELGRSTVYVTHDQDEALSLADRIVVLHEGKTQQIGNPEELYARPANLEVARFMGYRNILDLDAARVDGTRVALRGAGIALDGTAQQAISPGPVTVALRPDDVEPGGAGANAIEARVEIVEYCGRDWLVDLALPDSRTVYARSSRKVAPGASARCAVAPERVLVFPRPDDDYNDPTKPIELMVEFDGLQWGDGAKLGLSQPQCAMLTKPAKGAEPGTLSINLIVPQLLHAEAANDDAADEDADQDKKACSITLAGKHVVHRAEPIRAKLVKCIQVPALRDHADLLTAPGWTTYGAMLRGILADSSKLDELRNLIQQTNTVLTGLLSEETKALTATAKTAAYVDA
jgi:putative spermidine/putrescine transport system ATP-binding protein